MTECLIIQLILTRLAPPNRPYRYVLTAPKHRANRETLLPKDLQPYGFKRTSEITDAIDRRCKRKIANRGPSDNALSP